MFDFERFFAVPETFEAEGFEAADAGVKSVFLAGAEYDGDRPEFLQGMECRKERPKKIRLPESCSSTEEAAQLTPRGSKMWNDRGFAAIAIDMFGGVPQKDGAMVNAVPESERHEFSGPGAPEPVCKSR